MRPNTLAEALAWAGGWDATLPKRIIDRLGALSPVDPYVVIHAPNGIVGFQLMVSVRGKKIMQSIVQPSSWKTLLAGKFGKDLVIKRMQGQRVDTAYLLGTNGRDGLAPLSGRTILMAGCGAIGGFLSAALAQLGAGLDGGALVLVDDETLSARNTARHRLGAGMIGKNKAVACKQSLDESLPGLAVVALPMAVEKCRSRVLAADLVIDATGEQSVGDLLNAWRLEAAGSGGHSPALLHVWVDGNGAAAQTYFSSDSEFGCYRCLHPDLLQPPRFPVLKNDADVSQATACGEAPFSPYGPAAPMTAAGLAASHVLDWSRGNPRHLLRTVRLSYADTLERKPANPQKSHKCPACGAL